MFPPNQGPPGPQGPWGQQQAAAPDPQGPYRPMVTGYEFSEPENQVIRSIASTTKLVGIVNVVSLVVGAVAMLVTIVRLSGNTTAFIGGVIGGTVALGISAVFNLVVSYWMFRSSAAFTKVVQTQGNDMPNLVEALTYQRSFFGLLKTLTIIALCIIPLACVAGIFVAMAAAHR